MPFLVGESDASDNMFLKLKPKIREERLPPAIPEDRIRNTLLLADRSVLLMNS